MFAKILSLVGIMLILSALVGCGVLIISTSTQTFSRGFLRGETIVGVTPEATSEEGIEEEAVHATATAEAARIATAVAVAIAAQAPTPTIEASILASGLVGAVAALPEVTPAPTLSPVTPIPTRTPTATPISAPVADSPPAAYRPTPAPPPVDTPAPPPTETQPPPPPTAVVLFLPETGGSPLDTSESAPPILPDTGADEAQQPPMRSIQANWPKEMIVDRSDFIRVSLLRLSADEIVYIVEVEADREFEVIEVTPVPIPASTPGAPIESAFGREYKSVAVAELFYDPANFAVGEPSPRARQPFDQNKITWEWIITPKKPLNQTINLLIEAQWEPINDSGPAATPDPHPIWRSPLEIQVVPSPFDISLAFTPFALNLPNLAVTSLIGSILNIPLFVQWGKKIRKK